MRKLSGCLACVLPGVLATALAGPVLASGAAAPTDAQAGKEDSIPVPTVLHYQRPGIDSTYSEVYIYGGPFYGDDLRSSFLFGADYLLRFSDIFGIGPSFQYTHAVFPDVPAYQDTGFIKSSDMFTTSMLLAMSLPMAYRVADTVIRGELRTVLGGGAAAVNEQWSLYGFFGGGAKMYFLNIPWVALRLDIRGSLKGVPTPFEGTKVNSDLSILIGPAFNLPPSRD